MGGGASGFGTLAALVSVFLAERDRWSLWTPVGLGCGIAVYFMLPDEPGFWVGTLPCAVAALGAILWRRHQVPFAMLLCVFVITLGFVLAQARTHWVASPLLSKTVPGSVEGTVLRAEDRPSRTRLTISTHLLADLEPDQIPEQERLVLLRGDVIPRVGQMIRLRAVLRPPSPPVGPGAYDFQRAAYFKQLGGVGFATSRLLTLDAAIQEDWTVTNALASMRQSISARIRDAVPGAAGAVVSALLTGDRSGILEETMVEVRRSGLAHLLAISGLHMGLVAGFVFFVLRFLFALWQWGVLRLPAKKYAAVGALLFALFYLALSGGSVPTQRAFLMTALVLLAVLLDRTAISLRTVAWAASAILMVLPESLLSASFQLSFAAVVPLVAAYEALRTKETRWWQGASGQWWARPLGYLALLVFTSLVANLATAPFAAHRFNQVNTLGVPANLFAVPLTGFWIMPLGVIALLAMPFGLKVLPLQAMSWGVEGLLIIAADVSGRPEAVIAVARSPVAALSAVALAGLWLCLWRRAWRLAGVPVLLVAVLWGLSMAPPSVMIAGDGRLMAVRLADGTMALSTTRSRKFEAGTWMCHAGVSDSHGWLDESGDEREAPRELNCDSMGCMLKRGSVSIGLPMTGEGAWEDCQRANAVITPDRLYQACDGPRWVIDRRNLQSGGTHAIWITETGIRIETVTQDRGNRPWVIE
jgi:competence protein ComEC